MGREKNQQEAGTFLLNVHCVPVILAATPNIDMPPFDGLKGGLRADKICIQLARVKTGLSNEMLNDSDSFCCVGMTE